MAKKEIKKSKKSAQKTTTSLAAHQQQALKEYERAVGLLQQKKFSEATQRFKVFITEHPDEKEMTDRCRVYLRICERSEDDKPKVAKTADDLYYQGMLESNRQMYDRALESFKNALKTNPQDDRVVYVMATTLALKGEKAPAISHLRQAIDLNAINRAQAQLDSDFDGLREDEEFRDLVHPAKA